MKKFSSVIIIALLISGTMQSLAFAAESNLIEDIQLSLKAAETPNRLEVSFILSESIDLSQEDSNIIIEYFTRDDNGNLETMKYIKDKSWSGYLNSYEDYPSGERKYSSGYTNENYSDEVPAARIYTSTKTGPRIDVALAAAVKITVLRADGSGEAVTVDHDGIILDFEEIEAPDNHEIEIPEIEQNLGVRIYSESLPSETIVVAKEVTSGPEYDTVRSLLTDAINFIAIDITLELYGQEIRPDGKVKISIPIPEDFGASNVAVYRIENGTRIPYATTITTDGEIKYAAFLTDHFSTYVLAAINAISENRYEAQMREGTEIKAEREMAKEESAEEKITEKSPIEKTEQDKAPITGRSQTLNYSVVIIVFITGISLSVNTKKI